MLPGLLLASALFAADSTTYYVGFLRPDPARTKLDKAEAERIQTVHMAYIHSMVDKGQLVAAGPFEDTPHTISGIFVLRAASLEEARKIANADPTIQEHRNTMDVHAWHGPAGIGDEYFRLHKADAKTPEGMGVHPVFLMLQGEQWESPDRMALLAAHRVYWDGLRSKLGAIGGVEPAGLKGLVIFKRIPFDEAQAMIDADPAVKAGVLKPEGHHWWCAEHVLPL